MPTTEPRTGPTAGPSSDSSAGATEDRRAQILAAAIRVLARDGLARATTRAIAAEAGINQATLLYYAGSKDALLMAVLREMMRATREIALAAIPEGVGPREAIRRSVAAFWEHVEAAPELQVMQYELTLYALRHGDAAWLAREQYAGYAAVVEELLRGAYTSAGEPCAVPFDALARFIVGGLDGLILRFVSDRDTVRARRDRDTLIAAVLALADGGRADITPGAGRPPDSGRPPDAPTEGAARGASRRHGSQLSSRATTQLPSPRGRGAEGEVHPPLEERP